MKVDDRIKQLLNPVDGIPGVPSFWRVYCRERALKLRPADQEVYLHQTLEPMNFVMTEALDRHERLKVTTEHVRCEGDLMGVCRYLRLPWRPPLLRPLTMNPDDWLLRCAAYQSQVVHGRDRYRVVFLVAFLAALPPPRRFSWRNFYKGGVELCVMAGGLDGLYSPDLAAHLIEIRLGLKQSDYESETILSQKLHAGLDEMCRRSCDKSACVVTLAGSLCAQAGRGAAEAVRLYQAFLGTANVTDVTPQKLQIRRSWLDSLSTADAANNTSIMITMMAEAMRKSPSHGPASAASLLESYLKVGTILVGGDFSALPGLFSSDEFRKEYGGNNTRLQLVAALASAKAMTPAPGPNHGATLLEAAIGLTKRDYAQGSSLQDKLETPWVLADQQFVAKGASMGAIATLAECLIRSSDQEVDDAVRLLEAYLQIDEEMYGQPERLASKLREKMRIESSDLSSAALHVTIALVESLRRCSWRGVETVRAVAHVLPPSQVFEEKSATPYAAVRFATCYASCITGTAEGAITFCRNVVAFVRSVRVEQLPTYRHRLEFLEEARKIWPQIKRIALERADAMRSTGDVTAARYTVRELMLWSEQFKNRMLIEELFLEEPTAGEDGASLLDGWSPWSSDQSPEDGNDEQPPDDSSALSTSLCLGVSTDEVVQTRPSVSRALGNASLQRDEMLGNDQALEDLVPKAAIYIRALFDNDNSESRLRWWAWQHGAGKLEVVASGQSKEGARGELEESIQSFGAAVETFFRDPTRPEAAKEYSDAFDEYSAVMNRHLDLSGVSAAKADVFFHVEGPLLAMPLAWLESADGPMWEVCESTSSVISLTLQTVSKQFDCLPERRVLSAYWQRRKGKDWKQHLNKMCGLRNRIGNHLRDWELWSLGEPPDATRATRSRLSAALVSEEHRFGLVVIHAHGHAVSGIELAAYDWAEDRSNEGKERNLAADAWTGDGVNLEHTDLLVLASCSVGQLRDRGAQDVEGLYTRLAANRARTVIAARWHIHAGQTPLFVESLIGQYDKAIAESADADALPPFAKARAMAAARKAELQRDLFENEADCRAPTLAAFELYGLA